MGRKIHPALIILLGLLLGFGCRSYLEEQEIPLPQNTNFADQIEKEFTYPLSPSPIKTKELSPYLLYQTLRKKLRKQYSLSQTEENYLLEGKYIEPIKLDKTLSNSDDLSQIAHLDRIERILELRRGKKAESSGIYLGISSLGASGGSLMLFSEMETLQDFYFSGSWGSGTLVLDGSNFLDCKIGDRVQIVYRSENQAETCLGIYKQKTSDRAGDLKSAVRGLEKALKNNPSSSRLYLNRAEAYALLSGLENPVSNYQKAASGLEKLTGQKNIYYEFDSDKAKVYLYLGDYYLELYRLTGKADFRSLAKKRLITGKKLADSLGIYGEGYTEDFSRKLKKLEGE